MLAAVAAVVMAVLPPAPANPKLAADSVPVAVPPLAAPAKAAVTVTVWLVLLLRSIAVPLELTLAVIPSAPAAVEIAFATACKSVA